MRTADCADGLSCIANVCYAKNSKPTGGGAGDTSTPVGPVLGTEGETCSSRLDCAEGLGCFNQRCTTPPTDTPGEGGAPSTGVDLGARGESCRVNGDCSKGLVCIPSSLTAGTGVCDLAEYGIAPTGKKCGGECLTATDCCQLPTALQADPIKSCKDIDDAITTQAIDCATTAVVSALKLCFEKATYCTGCSATTWACTDNTCVYKPACVVAAGFDAPTGCPTNSRIHTLGLSCNPDTLKCVGAAAAVACTTDASCLAKPVVDRSLTSTDVCAAGECTCYAGDHQCYRKCARDIECAVGSACDTKAHVCISADTCSSNSECAVLHSSLDYGCNKGTGTCAKMCSSDHDCSASGHGTPTFNGMVCGADGFCASIASDCTDDTQCPALFPSALKTFCVDAPAGAAGGAVSSAISD